MNAENCPRDEGCFCTNPLGIERFGDTPQRTTRWTKFRKWLGL